MSPTILNLVARWLIDSTPKAVETEEERDALVHAMFTVGSLRSLSKEDDVRRQAEKWLEDAETRLDQSDWTIAEARALANPIDIEDYTSDVEFEFDLY